MEEVQKVYNSRAIRLGAFLGGPLAATYLMAANFKALGQQQRSRNTWKVGLLSTLALGVVLALLPENVVDKLPNIVIPSVTMAITHLILQKYQEPALTQLLESDGVKYSIWRAVGISLAFVLFCVAILVLIMFGADMYLTGGETAL